MRTLLAAVFLIVALMTAGVASAGELTKVGSTLRYTISSGDVANDVELTFCDPAAVVHCPIDPGPYYLVLDQAEAVSSPDGACSVWIVEGTTYWRCPSEGVERWEVSLGGGNDQFTFQVPGSGPVSTPVTVAGGDGDDEIFGTHAADTLNGGGGNDQLFGREDTDFIKGEAGDDIVAGEAGNDVLDGGLESDLIIGGPGAADLVSYADRTEGVTVNLGVGGQDDGSAEDGALGARDNIDETDIEGVIGGRGDDTLNGNALTIALRIRGGAGNDVLSGGLGPNTILGQTGNDELSGSDEVDLLSGGAGNDELDGLGEVDTVGGDAGRDVVEGRDGNLDDLDCGTEVDSARSDVVDLRASCEPSTAITAKPPKTTGSRSASFQFSSTTPNAGFQCRLDGGAWVTCNSGAKTYTGLSRTQHTFRVRARDLDGTLDPTPATWTWRVT